MGEEEELPDFASLRDDLIPSDSFVSLGVISWEMLESLRQGVQTHQAGEISKVGDGFPVILTITP